MAKVAVVILNYNGKNYLEKFLPQVTNYSPEAIIIVADNASTDSSVDFLKKNYSELPLIELEENYGFAGGYNKALEQIEAEYFILLNSDVEVTKGWIKPLIDFLDKNKDYVACQPKILAFNQRTHFEYAGAAGGFLDRFGYPFCRGRIFDAIEEDQGQYDDSIDVFWASGACMVVRASVYQELKGFDDDFFAHMEEIDLCWRMLNRGLKIRYIPTSKVYHVGGGTLDQSSPFKTYLNFRNSMNVLVKNLPGRQLIGKLFIRWALDWVAICRFIIRGEFKHALAILKAHISILTKFRKTWKKRGIGGSNWLKSYAIVFRFFIKNKKKYSSL